MDTGRPAPAPKRYIEPVDNDNIVANGNPDGTVTVLLVDAARKEAVEVTLAVAGAAELVAELRAALGDVVDHLRRQGMLPANPDR